jgi:xylulokinase
MELFLGIDVGTYETKGVLVDAAGRVHAEARARHGISTPAPGMVEQDADAVWWDDLVQVASTLRQAAPDAVILAVACSAIGPCVLPVDAELRPLRPAILYGVDTRATAEIDLLETRLGREEIFRRAGNALTSQSAGPKVLWIERNEPEIAARTRWYLTSQSYLVARLTGRVVIDHATAGYFHPCYDLARLDWDVDGVDDLIRPDTLPPLGWATDVAGTVTAAAAEATGIPEGTPVLVGTTDAVAEAVGASVVAADDLMLMYGSSGYFIRVADEPYSDPRLWAAPFALRDRYVLAAGTSTAGTATRWIADVLGLDHGDGDAAMFGRLMELVRSAPPGADGVLHLPHFSGERTPLHDPDARAAFTGLTLTTGRAELARAVVEGVGTSIALAVSALLDAGAVVPRVVAIGGGTRNEVLLQTVSDLTGLVQRTAATLGAAYGDAMLAAIGLGVVTEEEAAGWVAFSGEIVPQDSGEDQELRASSGRFPGTYRALRALREAD